MTDATKTPRAIPAGFSSRWMLDGRAGEAATVGGDAGAAARAIDTDGDGVADTLALRVDAAPDRRSAWGTAGAWIARSFVTIVLVAALVVAGMAITSLLQTRQQLDDARADVTRERSTADAARAEAADAQRDVARLERDAGTTTSDTAKLTDERDELRLENDVLRRMLLDADRGSSTTGSHVTG